MKKEFSWRFAFLIGLASIGGGLLWPIFNNYVPIFLQTGHPLWEGAAENVNIIGFAIGPTMAAFIMTWDNIIHMFLVPWAGTKSDQTWTRFGRRIPWLLVGIPIAIIGFTLIPFATSVFLLILFIMLTNIGTGIFRAPARAWLGDFFAPADRSKAEAPIHFIIGFAAVATALVGGALFDRGNISAPFVIGTIIVIVGTIPALIWLKEDKDLEIEVAGSENKSNGVLELLGQMRKIEYRSVLFAFLGTFFFHTAHGAIQAGLSGFGVFELGMTTGRIAQITGIMGLAYIILAIPSGLVANRYGTRRTMLIGMVIYFVCSVYIGLLVQSESILLILLIIIGGAWSLIFVNSLPLLLNTDEGKNFGVFTGLYYLAFQAASIVGPLLSGGLIQLTGSQRAMWGVIGVSMLFGFFALVRVSDRDFEEVGDVLASD